MNCPYCDFHFKAIMSPVEKAALLKEEIIPSICERCANISVFIRAEGGQPQRLTPEQIEILKTSPAWKQFLKPALDIIVKGPEYLNWKRSHQ